MVDVCRTDEKVLDPAVRVLDAGDPAGVETVVVEIGVGVEVVDPCGVSEDEIVGEETGGEDDDDDGGAAAVM